MSRYDPNPRVSDFVSTKKVRALARRPSVTAGALVAGAAVLGGALLWSRDAGATIRPYTPGGTTPEANWQAKIRSIAAPLIQATGWYGLDDYLIVVAYTESRGHSTAGGKKPGRNAARGWFGMRPDTGLVGVLKGSPGNLLLDPRVAVATAADLAWRLGGEDYRGPRVRTQVPWGAIRRGWALPSLVKDYNWSKPRSQDVLRRMNLSEKATGLVGLQNAMAFPRGMNWVGLNKALNLVGYRMT